MFVDGGWRARQEPPRREPRLTRRQESVLVWLVGLNLLLLLLAPIGGATLFHAVAALLVRVP